MHVDGALLERVMRVTGTTNKTHAIDLALREMDRRHELTRLAEAGLGLAPDELRDAYDPATPVETVKISAIPTTPVHYGRKPRSH